jgi:hypothetical protein
MTEIAELREMRPAPLPAELEAMRTAARDRFVTGTVSRRARQRWRLPVLAGGLTSAAAAAAAAALVLTSGAGAVPGQDGTAGHTRSVVTAAWTVHEDANGTVTIYLQEYANPAGLQETLQADGINAIVRAIPWVPRKIGNQTVPFPTCNYVMNDVAPLAVQRDVTTILAAALPARFIIHPDAMPHGSALFLAFMAGVPQNFGDMGFLTLKPRVLTNDTVPACVPVHKEPPPGGISLRSGSGSA